MLSLGYESNKTKHVEAKIFLGEIVNFLFCLAVLQGLIEKTFRHNTAVGFATEVSGSDRSAERDHCWSKRDLL